MSHYRACQIAVKLSMQVTLRAVINTKLHVHEGGFFVNLLEYFIIIILIYFLAQIYPSPNRSI